MANIESLKRQHTDISEDIGIIKDLVKKTNFQEDSSEIAKHISLLAGKLKIHLDTEDKFLYPELLNSKDAKIKKMANDYIKEMGNLCQSFTVFKNQFNTKTKIINNLSDFKIQSIEIINLLEKRISKEDRELYLIIK